MITTPIRRKAYIIFLCTALCLLFVLHPNLSHARDSEIKIVTSVFPLAEFSKAVVGDVGQVSLLLPPGAEVHTWKPRPSDIVRLSKADLFVYVGANLEPWIHNILRSIKNPNLRVLEATRIIPLMGEGETSHDHEHEHGTVDPHVWLDFEADQLIVDGIASVLSEMDPERTRHFQDNAFLYKDKLQKLHRRYEENLRDCSERTFILGGHSAFGYLARKYHLRQLSLYGLSPDSKPTPKQMVEVVELAKKHEVKAIYFEIFVSDELAKVIAKEVGAQTLVLNPGANLTRDQLDAGIDFFDIMEKNLENLRHGLGCR